MRKLMVMMAIFWSILSYGKEERVHPSQPPKLDFPMHWSVIAYNLPVPLVTVTII